MHKLNNSQTRKQNNFFVCQESSTSLIKKLQQNLEDLTQQLQLSNAKNAQLTKLVQIVTNERNYYSEQLGKSESSLRLVEQQLSKLRIQMDTKIILVNQLKKANRTLAQQVQLTNQSLQQTKFLFEAQEQQISRIKKQKELIQCEWSRVIKEVNTKMSRIQKQQQEQYKQNIQITANLPLKEKVKKALRKIDKQLQCNQNPKQRCAVKSIGNTWNSVKISSSFSTSGNQLHQQDSVSY